MKSAMTDMADNNNPSSRLDSSSGLNPKQISVAVELGIDVATLGSAEAVVEAIESKLGKAAEEQCARWFVISVLGHLRKAKWADLSDSGLNEARQINLAKDCLAVKGFSSSLRIVTKDARSKFRIVGFSSSKKIEKVVLATGTKAYKIASYVILEAELVEQQAKKKARSRKKSKEPRSELEKAEKTVVGRRAKRRGYSEDEFMSVVDAAEVTSGKQQAVSMSKEEFADLDVALSNSDTEIIQQNWSDQQDEERWSRILGLLAGVGFFVCVALLFLW
tara:strand:- start:21660 stop:22487 length:828 start_codon:yes stop_codon:yes gene_type:complete